eukprot:10357809-Ditylum_brightwellii.AAC.1
MLVDQNKRLLDVVSELVQEVKKQKFCSCGQLKGYIVDESTVMNMPLQAGQMSIAEAFQPNNKYMPLSHDFHNLTETVLNHAKLNTVFDT